jgi:L-aspartate oxidase
MSDDGVVLVNARATMLALGGAGALFESTTNNPASTGDSLAMASEVGVRLSDLEFIQFHPTALAVAESPRPLLTEALRGAGAVLVDANGHPIMPGVHPDGDLAPRHVVTAAILGAGQAFLDARSLGEERLEREFPTVVTSCRKYGFNPATEPIPVTPAAHYMIGGVETDLDGRASLPGLFAAGECAATGVHGANRMAGNSLSESAVFAYRAARAMTSAEPAAAQSLGPTAPEPPGQRPSSDLRRQIIVAVTLGAGPIRDAESSAQALVRLRDLAGSTDAREAAAMIASGQLLVEAALAREETRGVHVRSDFPETNPALDGVHLTAAG